MEFLHTPKEFNVLRDRVLSHWVPTRRSSHACAGLMSYEDHVVKEAWEGQGGAQPNTHVI